MARFEELESQEFQKRNETKDLYPFHPGHGWATRWVEVTKNVWKGFGDRLLIDGLVFNLPEGRPSSASSAPTAPAKPPCSACWSARNSRTAASSRIGDTVQLAYVDQSATTRSNKTVWQEISDGLDVIAIGSYQINSRAYAGRFNFKGRTSRSSSDLSGGERNRIHLAKLLKNGGNVLLLDEPTNDLDVETLRALEEALLAFAGCAVIISHDRWFLDRIATHIRL